ncbi:MAG: PEP-CTERM sorting domain-containing protein [Rubrivivax sp.]|nr:PEP-CTERM sorting domain-containing protein [Rubrivivax sp.]
MLDLGATISRVTGAGAAGQIANNVIDGTEGRFDTSGDGQWWLTAVSFQIDFDQNISAFGFYGTDFGDFAGSFLMELLLSNGTTKAYDLRDVMAPANSPTNGWLQFIGVVDDTNSDQISAVRFSITQGSDDPDDWDFLGFDSFVVGDVATSSDVPEPGSLALVGASLLALAASRRRRKA